MGSGGEPKTTKSSSGSFSIGGQNLATSTLGPGGYNTKVNFNPDQQKTWDTANSGISSALSGIGNIIKPFDPSNPGAQSAQQKQYAQDLYQPVAQNITNQANISRDQAYSRFANIGGLNSLGFNRYNDNMISKNENQALSSAQSQANTQAYSLPSMLLSPIQQALQAYQGAQSGLLGQATGSSGMAMQGQQASNQYNTANNLFNGGKSGGGNIFSNTLDPFNIFHQGNSVASNFSYGLF